MPFYGCREACHWGKTCFAELDGSRRRKKGEQREEELKEEAESLTIKKQVDGEAKRRKAGLYTL